MGTEMVGFLWRVALLLLPAVGLSEAVPAHWLPGNYTATDAQALAFVQDYNGTAEEVLFHSVSASWTYNTNLTDHNSALQVRWGNAHVSPVLGVKRALANANSRTVEGFCGAEPRLTWRSPLFISLQIYMLSFLQMWPTQLACYWKSETDLNACGVSPLKYF